jgi:hypothetical protein
MESQGACFISEGLRRNTTLRQLSMKSEERLFASNYGDACFKLTSLFAHQLLSLCPVVHLAYFLQWNRTPLLTSFVSLACLINHVF